MTNPYSSRLSSRTGCSTVPIQLYNGQTIRSNVRSENDKYSVPEVNRRKNDLLRDSDKYSVPEVNRRKIDLLSENDKYSVTERKIDLFWDSDKYSVPEVNRRKIDLMPRELAFYKDRCEILQKEMSDANIKNARLHKGLHSLDNYTCGTQDLMDEVLDKNKALKHEIEELQSKYAIVQKMADSHKEEIGNHNLERKTLVDTVNSLLKENEDFRKKLGANYRSESVQTLREIDELKKENNKLKKDLQNISTSINRSTGIDNQRDLFDERNSLKEMTREVISLREENLKLKETNGKLSEASQKMSDKLERRNAKINDANKEVGELKVDIEKYEMDITNFKKEMRTLKKDYQHQLKLRDECGLRNNIEVASLQNQIIKLKQANLVTGQETSSGAVYDFCSNGYLNEGNESNNLQEKIKGLMGAAEQFNDVIDALNSDKKDLLIRIENYQTSVDHLQRDLKDVQDLVKQYENENRNLERKIEHSLQEIEDLSKSNAIYMSQIENLKTELKRSQIRDLGKVNPNIETYRQGTYQSLPQNDNRHSFSSIQSDSCKSPLSLEQENINLSSKLLKFEKLIQEKDCQISEISNKCSELFKSQENFQMKIRNMEEELLDIDKEAEKYKYKYERSQEEAKDLFEKNNQIRKELNEKREEDRILKEECQLFEKKISDIEIKMNMSQSEVNSYKQMMIDTNKKTEDLTKENRNLNDILKERSGDSNKSSDVISKYNERIENLQKENKRFQEKIEGYNTRSINSDSEKKDLQEEIERLTILNGNLKKDIEQLTASNVPLRRPRASSASYSDDSTTITQYRNEEGRDLSVEQMKTILIAKDEELTRKQNALNVMKEKIKNQSNEFDVSELTRLRNQNILYTDKLANNEAEIKRLNEKIKELNDQILLLKKDMNTQKAEMDNIKRLKFVRNSNASPDRIEGVGTIALSEDIPSWWKLHMI